MKTTTATAGVTDPHLKDVYAAWLQDLYDDKSAKVVKTLRRAKQQQQQQRQEDQSSGARVGRRERKLRVLQPTEASASKHISQRQVQTDPSTRQHGARLHHCPLSDRVVMILHEQEPKLPVLVRPSAAASASTQHESQQRRHQALTDEANCSNYAYRAPLAPGLAFFALLATAAVQSSSSSSSSSKSSASVAKHELRAFPIRIPPTLLRMSDANALHRQQQQHSTPFRVALLFTQSTHESAAAPEDASSELVLHVHVFTTEQQYREQRRVLLRLFTSSAPADAQAVVAVSKVASDDDERCRSKSNATSLLRGLNELEVAVDTLWHADVDAGSARAIQKYVPFKGSASSSATPRAWIARAVYRKRDRASWVWILTDSDSAELTDSHRDSCQLVKCSSTASWTDPRLLAATCSQSFEALLQLSLTELALDLVQDTSGAWWLLQVKAFQLRRQSRPSSACGAATTFAPANEADRATSAPDRLESIGAGGAVPHKKWRCAGRFCNERTSDTSDNAHEYASMLHTDASTPTPSGYLTKKVLLTCEFYDAYMTRKDMSVTSGFADVRAALAFHLQHEISKRERNQLYESQPLCSACVRKYHFLHEQWHRVTGAAPAEPLEARRAVKRSALVRTSDEVASRPTENPRRLLPALVSASSLPSLTAESAPTMQSSCSAPSVLRRHGVKGSPGTLASSAAVSPRMQRQPAYVSEMERIEAMLATHDATFASSASISSSNASNQTQDEPSSSDVDTSTTDFASRHFSRFLQQQRHADSVDEMWKSVTFTPIASAAAPAVAKPPTYAYNMYSMASELSKQLAEIDTGALAKNNHRQVPLESRQSLAPTTSSSSSVSQTLTVAGAVHTIAIEHCRQVFYDEAYRERVVRDAKAQLFEHERALRIVVLPSTHTQPEASSSLVDGHASKSKHDEQDDALAEMVLCSLYLDLSQSAPTHFAPLFRGRPCIAREASGCTTLTLSIQQ